MKKSFLLLGLLTTTLCLTACGSKDFNMTFEEALEVANHSELQGILAGNDNFEQNFAIAGNYSAEGTKVDGSISSTSKQSLTNKNSESSTTFSANITSSGETIKANGVLDIKLIDDTVYLNIPSLDLTGSEDLSFIAMMTAGFKGQWFSIPVTGLSDMPNTFSVLKDSKELNTKTKEIIKNEGSMVYNGKFTQFNGYNAWKFSLDNEKLNALIKEYYDAMNTNLDDEYLQEAPEINIQNFEGYLVITGKDKVTTVIENMKIQDNETTLNARGFAGEDLELYFAEDEEDLISIVAQKKSGKYNVSITVSDIISLDGTISPKLSKSSIDLKFDGKLTIKAETEGENNTVIPFNGSRKYNSISEFTTTVPENTQDLTELLGSYLGGLMGGDELNFDDEGYDYEDLYNEDLDLENINLEATGTEENTETTENGENVENTEIAE